MLQWEETKKFIADTAIYNISTAGQDKDSSQNQAEEEKDHQPVERGAEGQGG